MTHDLLPTTHTSELTTMPTISHASANPAGKALPIINAACELDAEGHCITCSDEAIPVKIVSIDQASGLALVEVQNVIEEIDITLVDDVNVGDVVLVHGGVAIGHPDEEC